MPRQDVTSFKAFEALTIADCTRWEDERPLGERLDELTYEIDNEYARLVGTNVVGASVRIPDDVIEETCTFSIIGHSTEISGVCEISHSCVCYGAKIVDSVVKESHVEGTSVYKSTVYKSMVDEAASVTLSYIHDSEVGLGARFVNSAHVTESKVLTDSVFDNVNIEEANITGRRDFMDFGTSIGTGERVYAYIALDGKLVIMAGCKNFKSTREMLSYAETAREYEDLAPQTRQSYLSQIRAASRFINATLRAKKIGN